jgi:hypothetical protein
MLLLLLLGEGSQRRHRGGGIAGEGECSRVAIRRLLVLVLLLLLDGGGRCPPAHLRLRLPLPLRRHLPTLGGPRVVVRVGGVRVRLRRPAPGQVAGCARACARARAQSRVVRAGGAEAVGPRLLRVPGRVGVGSSRGRHHGVGGDAGLEREGLLDVGGGVAVPLLGVADDSLVRVSQHGHLRQRRPVRSHRGQPAAARGVYGERGRARAEDCCSGCCTRVVHAQDEDGVGGAREGRNEGAVVVGGGGLVGVVQRGEVRVGVGGGADAV